MGIDLKDAVASIQTKISTSANSASPEELAYLGTAIDKIGGRATVLEVVETGEIVKNDINELNTTLKQNMNVDFTTRINETIQTVDNTLNNMVNSASVTETTTIDNINTARDNAETYINDVTENLKGDIDNKENTTLSDFNSLVDSKVQSATSSVNSVTTELQSAADELSSAASLANAEAVNSSLFTMLALSSI